MTAPIRSEPLSWTMISHNIMVGRTTPISTGCVLTMQNKVGFEVMVSTWHCLTHSFSLYLSHSLFLSLACAFPYTHISHSQSSRRWFFSLSYTHAQSPHHWIPFSISPSPLTVLPHIMVCLFPSLPLHYWVTSVCNFLLLVKKNRVIYIFAMIYRSACTGSCASIEHLQTWTLSKRYLSLSILD